jgi:hypothetical protein
LTEFFFTQSTKETKAVFATDSGTGQIPKLDFQPYCAVRRTFFGTFGALGETILFLNN